MQRKERVRWGIKERERDRGKTILLDKTVDKNEKNKLDRETSMGSG